MQQNSDKDSVMSYNEHVAYVARMKEEVDDSTN